MAFESRDQLVKSLRSVWSEGDELRLGMSIIDMIQDQPEAVHFPYSRFLGLANRLSLDDPALVQRVVDYLTGAESHVLELCAELIEEDDSVHTLKSEQLRLALQHGIHPLTGRRDDAVADSIFVFFSPSDMARRVLWK